MGYPWVSATRSHARTRGWLYLACAASHTSTVSKSILSPPCHLSPSTAPCHQARTASRPPSRAGAHTHPPPPPAIKPSPSSLHPLETAVSSWRSHPPSPTSRHQTTPHALPLLPLPCR